MHPFHNTNYICAGWNREIGIHYYHCCHQNRSPRRQTTINCFVVRVPSKNGHGITSYKADTKEAAEELFRKHCPGWEGPIPYKETIAKKFKSK